MISLNNVSINFGDFELFKEISFMVQKRDRIGLVGKNGAGKTTLLRVIVGQMVTDTGNVSFPTDMTFGYLPQQMKYVDGKTVYQEAVTAFDEVMILQKKTDKINTDLASRTDYDSEEYIALIEELTALSERFDILGGGMIQAKTENTLLGLGFLSTDFHRATKEFSGGWRMRIELAKVLLKHPDVLLLDEPTNHLDIESIQWLEEFLENYKGAVVMISHDRAFLDNVTHRTIEISLGKIYDYKVNYSKYVVLRQERREKQIATYRNQQKMIEDTERFIERFRYKATKSTQVQSRIKQLDKLERVEVDDVDESAIHFRFPSAPRSGTIVLEMKSLSKCYGTHQVLENIDLIVERGEKIAFVGKNGEGKTTLTRIILNELDYTGTLKLGHNINIGYFAQNQDDLLDGTKTVFQTLDDIAVGDIRTRIRAILGSFLFSGEDIDKKVRVLSGGEQSRLALAKLLLEPYNIMVMDEPTNHLDMRSKDILKQALLKYDGTLIIVSHDRYFLDGLVTKVYEFGNRKVKENIGGIYDFLRKKKLASLQELERKSIKNTSSELNDKSTGKQSYLQRKEADKEVRKVQSEITRIESRISTMEQQLAKLSDQLTDPAKIPASSDYNDLHKRYQELKDLMNSELRKWEQKNYELEIILEKRDGLVGQTHELY